MALELKDLRYFIAVAEEGHVTRAAERLGMEQPPLSIRIKALEQHLDLQLFRRKPRGMELTDAGRTLLEEARQVLLRLDHAVAATKSVARGQQGRLRIGIAPTAPFHPFVPRSIRSFRAAYPQVVVTISEGLSDEVRQQLLEKQIDVAFVRVADMREESLTADMLLEEPLIAALPAKHPLAARSTIRSIKALEHDAFVLYGPPGTAIYDATVRACAAAGFSPVIGQLAPRITSTLGFVAAGMGVALVPASMRQVVVDGVAYVNFGPSVRAKAVLALASRRNDSTAIVRNFIASVRKHKSGHTGDAEIDVEE
jgi:DNA-binding transcriptional LysR family regulator